MKRKSHRMIILLALTPFVWYGCLHESSITSPGNSETTTFEVVSSPAQKAGAGKSFNNAKNAKNKHANSLLTVDGVVGVGVGLDDDGNPAVVVLTESGNHGSLPSHVDGVNVKASVVGDIRSLAAPARSQAKPTGPPAVDPTQRFDRPVPTGVSTGHPDITAGTIGCRVMDGSGLRYILTNNHVHANENIASIGDAVIQPGTYDGGSSPDDNIGTLADYEPIVFSTSANNTIDAAVSSTSVDNVGVSTFDGYGTPGAPDGAITTADIGIRVLKCGRTTGCTEGRVDVVNATVNVGYDTGTARFINQVIIKNVKGVSFSDGGDSGSLIVKKSNNSAYALLFAGSSTTTIGSPIDVVLARFGVVVDYGQDPPLPSEDPGSISGTVTDAATSLGIEGASVSAAGKSTLTGADGSYSLADVAVGTHNVSVSAAGYSGASQSADVSSGVETSGVDFALDEFVGPTDIFVTSVVHTFSGGGPGGNKNLVSKVTLDDNLGGPGAGLATAVTLENTTTGWSTTGSGTTGSDGTISFRLRNAGGGCYTLTVDNITTPLTWDGVTPANEGCK